MRRLANAPKLTIGNQLAGGDLRALTIEEAIAHAAPAWNESRNLVTNGGSTT